MVSEHRKQGYTEDLLAGTFSLSSAGNGLMAILAGLLAQRATGNYSPLVILSHCSSNLFDQILVAILDLSK
jgi:hypothetical protein